MAIVETGKGNPPKPTSPDQLDQLGTAFERLLPQLLPRARQLFGPDYAQDAVQIIFLKIMDPKSVRSLDTSQPPEAQKHYLQERLARDRRTYIRSRRRHPETSLELHEETTETHHVESKPFEEDAVTELDLQNALAKLSETDRAIFQLTLKGLEEEKIAEQLALTTGAVQTRRWRAKKKLAKTLQEDK